VALAVDERDGVKTPRFVQWAVLPRATWFLANLLPPKAA
jgi:hypothetical protein